jgi:NAD-dependent deacetylase
MVTALFEKQIEGITDILRHSLTILFITGAGISAESGLPTYRGISGLYNQKETEDGIRIEEALSGTMMRDNPEITWKYLAQMEKACRGKSYNRAHEVIALLEKKFERVCVLTQNVDGFHHKAGSTNVIDIHGSLNDLYCLHCRYEIEVADYNGLEIPPVCPKCKYQMRPDVVLFEEYLSPAKTQRLSEEFQKGFDVVFSIGTTSVFPYIAQPVLAAQRAGIPTIEINPARTAVSDFVKIKLAENAVITMNTLWMLLNRPPE